MKEDSSLLGLSTIRGNRGITLEQISDATKIAVRLLAAIEQGDFSKLPGGIYNTSYIRQYAKAIDYDEGALLAAYHRLTGIPDQIERKGPSSTSGNLRTAPITGS